MHDFVSARSDGRLEAIWQLKAKVSKTTLREDKRSTKNIPLSRHIPRKIRLLRR